MFSCEDEWMCKYSSKMQNEFWVIVEGRDYLSLIIFEGVSSST